ncbi:MAG: helix-turn-helix domain-containing protein [Clostridia bacterium]|nr:helix-turn-helix domain-containing protein [Clostridia bacterium]
MSHKRGPERLVGGFEWFRIDADRRSDSYPSHWHDFYEFEWVRKGAFVHCMNDNETLLKTGNLVLCTTSDIHSLIVDRGEVELITVHFDESYLTDTSKKAISSLKNREFSFDEKTVRTLDDIFDVLSDIQANKFSNKKENIKNRIETILLYCVEADAGEKAKLSGVMEAVGFIDSNFRENISLEKASGIAGLSRGAFSAEFHKKMGCTFQEYLIKKRIKWACTLLKHTELNVTQVAFDSGFHSHSHFSHSFKKHKGTAPLTYRENYLKSVKVD